MIWCNSDIVRKWKERLNLQNKESKDLRRKRIQIIKRKRLEFVGLNHDERNVINDGTTVARIIIINAIIK